jgi:isoleucyl-tRNA synthetase
VISTEITEALQHEGWVRDFIRSVQDQRKEQRLAYDARIVVQFNSTDDALARVIDEWAAAISGETLADRIERVDVAPEHGKVATIDQSEVTVGVVLS